MKRPRGAVCGQRRPCRSASTFGTGFRSGPATLQRHRALGRPRRRSPWRTLPLLWPSGTSRAPCPSNWCAALG
eukprot:10284576-Lingulodinium_polyedra.AAC.1